MPRKHKKPPPLAEADEAVVGMKFVDGMLLAAHAKVVKLLANALFIRQAQGNDFDIGNPGLILNTDQSIDTTFNRLILKAPLGVI